MPLVVGELQPAGRLQDVAGRHLGVELAVLLDQVAQRLALDELHAEVVDALVLADVVDLHDVVVDELGGGVGLAGEAGHERRVAWPSAGFITFSATLRSSDICRAR